MIGVFDAQPSFLYTIGLTVPCGFELIETGLPIKTAHIVLNTIALAILNDGETIELDKNDERWTNMPVRFRETSNKVREYVCQADQFYYRDVRVLQMVLCDRNGKFPGEPGFDADYMATRQTII